MAGITPGEIGSTFNLPNFHGQLFNITPTDTPLLSLSGGLGGGKSVTSTRFEWQTEDLRAPEIRVRTEGADAPDNEARVRARVENVVQIYHESVKTSYTKLAANGQFSTAGVAPFTSAHDDANPVLNEHVHQISNALKTTARDVNYAFWHGKFANPSTNVGRQMGGLIEAMTSNVQGEGAALTGTTATTVLTVTHALDNGDKVVVLDSGASTLRKDRVYYVVEKSTTVSFKLSATPGGSALTLGSGTMTVVPAKTTLTVAGVNDLMRSVFDNGGISEGETATLFVSSTQKAALTKAYITEYGKSDLLAGTRNVAGMTVQTVITDFGTLNVVIDRALPPDAISVVSLEQVNPVFLETPGKGVLFVEELAKTGSSEKHQLYGEIGLQYGYEGAHGILRGLAA